jgi:putative toxin-antitoxin system antitoxin component (TIGR02293 family)
MAKHQRKDEIGEGAWPARGLALVVAMPETHLTAFEKIDLIRQGIPKKSLEYFKQKSGLGYDQLANLLSVARATLINKKANEKFNQTLSERILRLADIYSQGYDVFGDLERFNNWIFRPNRALAGKAPYDLLDNDYGREEVGNLIGRIDAGVYS